MKEPRRHPVLLQLGTILDQYSGQRGYQLIGGAQHDIDISLVNHYADFVIRDSALGELVDFDVVVIRGKVVVFPKLSLNLFTIDEPQYIYAHHEIPLENGKLDRDAVRRVIKIVDGEISRVILDKASKLTSLSSEIEGEL